MFGGGPPGCTAQVASEAGLALGRCGCPEYTTDRAAFGDEPPAVDVVELRLRRPGEPRPAEAPPVKPVRDLLDSGRRLRDLSEFAAFRGGRRARAGTAEPRYTRPALSRWWRNW